MGLYQNRIVVKVGTSTLTNGVGKSDLQAIDRLVRVLSDIHNMGYEVILVSSGAIAVGTNKLNMKARPTSIRMKQAVSAVGQCRLMFLYDKFFDDYDKTIAQILLSAEDIEQEEKKENLINTFNSLLEMGVIPVVNENDSVSLTEIESEDRMFGDNDMLSAVVAILCKAKYLVILSEDSKRDVTKTKRQAADLAIANGIDAIITNGKKPEIIYDVINEKTKGGLSL